MQMVGHDDILRDFRVGVVLRDLFDALAGIFPHRRQNHRAVFDFAEIMFAVLCADGDEIGPAVVIVPPGPCGVNPVFVFEFVVGHVSHGMMTTKIANFSFRDCFCKNSVAIQKNNIIFASSKKRNRL